MVQVIIEEHLRARMGLLAPLPDDSDEDGNSSDKDNQGSRRRKAVRMYLYRRHQTDL